MAEVRFFGSRSLAGAPCENKRATPAVPIPRAQDFDTENALAPKLIRGMFVATLALSAGAQASYIEVWNPPEARASAIPATPKVVKRRHVSVSRTRPAPSSAKVVATHKVRTAPHSGLTYDDIPRKVTPEGNVLRVSGALASVRVEH